MTTPTPSSSPSSSASSSTPPKKKSIGQLTKFIDTPESELKDNKQKKIQSLKTKSITDEEYIKQLLNKILEKAEQNKQKIEDEPNEDKKKEMEELQRLKEEKMQKLNNTLKVFLNTKEPNSDIKSKIKKKQKKII